ncbi:hypothetical protein AAVH_16891 [Aphelenchoides avenae]|nr:hypothetical protein AAVH_16891 [Aphelenchus avenae]
MKRLVMLGMIVASLSDQAALPRHALSADAKEANPLATIPLRADNDRLYVAYVVVGTPGTAFALALDMRIHGVVVVDAMSLEIKKEHVFTRTSSSTYQPVHVGFEYASGTDVASFPLVAGLVPPPSLGRVTMVSLLRVNKSDTDYQPFFTQPFGGLFFYRDSAQTPYTVFLDKTCGADSYGGAITYGAVDTDNCGTFVWHTPPQQECLLPILTIDSWWMRVGDTREGPWSAIVATVPNIILPWALPHGDEYMLNCDAKPFGDLKDTGYP